MAIKSNITIQLVFVVCIFLFVSCSEKVREYETRVACVLETKPIHWWHGYYRFIITYEFEYCGQIITSKEKTRGYSRIHSPKYNVGDSVVVRFPKNAFEKSSIVGLKYIKSRNHHIYLP